MSKARSNRRVTSERSRLDASLDTFRSTRVLGVRRRQAPRHGQNNALAEVLCQESVLGLTTSGSSASTSCPRTWTSSTRSSGRARRSRGRRAGGSHRRALSASASPTARPARGRRRAGSPFDRLGESSQIVRGAGPTDVCYAHAYTHAPEPRPARRRQIDGLGAVEAAELAALTGRRRHRRRHVQRAAVDVPVLFVTASARALKKVRGVCPADCCAHLCTLFCTHVYTHACTHVLCALARHSQGPRAGGRCYFSPISASPTACCPGGSRHGGNPRAAIARAQRASTLKHPSCERAHVFFLQASVKYL